jgi:cytoskeletal protein RodZ
MSVQKGRPSRFWVVIVGVALLLLGIILVMVILLSARLRQPDRVTVVQPAPVGTVPGAAPPASASSHTAPVAARSSATPTSSQRHDAKTDRSREKPARVVERPVKVIEKEVKVVEKQVKVVEKPVIVTRKPARERPPPSESNDRAPVPTTRPSDRESATGTFLETGLPNQLTYAGKVWNASDLVKDLSADLLAADSRTVDGHTIYHDEDAAPPFPHIYVKVAGETDQYVPYVPTSS